MTTILGISGSLRAGSRNTALLRAAAGVAKNTIDWLSRPPSDSRRVFGDRPFAVIGASPGGFGTILAQAAWLPVLRTLGARHWSGGRLMLSRATQAFDEQGELQYEALREQLRKFVAGIAAFAGG